MKTIENMITDLFDAKPMTLRDLYDGQRDMYDGGAVYAISTPDDSSVVSIGQSSVFRHRMSFHVRPDRAGNQDLPRMIDRHPNHPTDPGSYLVRYLAIEDHSMRSELKSAAIRKIRPAFNRSTR